MAAEIDSGKAVASVTVTPSVTGSGVPVAAAMYNTAAAAPTVTMDTANNGNDGPAAAGFALASAAQPAGTDFLCCFH